MSTYDFTLRNLQHDPFNFYLSAADVDSIFFRQSFLAFDYIQISNYEGMRELFRHPNLIKPKSYKKIGKAYNLSGVLINDGSKWQLAKETSQKSLFQFNTEEVIQVSKDQFTDLKESLGCSLETEVDLLPIIRVYIQQCLNQLFFNYSDWSISAELSRLVRELEVIMFKQQWSPFFQLFNTNLLHLKTKKKSNELYEFYKKINIYSNEESRFHKWIIELQRIDKNLNRDNRDFVFNEVFNLWVAANEATSNTLCWTLNLVAQALEKSPQLIDDSAFLPGSLLESQRLFPAAYFIAREATDDINYKDQIIKKGSLINFSTYAMNRNKHNFTDPSIFNYNRQYKNLKANKPPFSFGHGKRICSGRAMSEILMKTFLDLFFNHFEIKPSTKKVEPLAHVSLSSKTGFYFKIREKKKTENPYSYKSL